MSWFPTSTTSSVSVECLNILWKRRTSSSQCCGGTDRQGDSQTDRQTDLGLWDKRTHPGKVGRNNGISEGHPRNLWGWGRVGEVGGQLWFSHGIRFCTCWGRSCRTQEAFNYISCVFTWCFPYWLVGKQLLTAAFNLLWSNEMTGSGFICWF